MSRYAKDPRDFGAVGDGITDDTAALQATLDAAAESSGEVYLGPGVWRTRTLYVPQGVSIYSNPTWSYKTEGHTVLVPADPEQPCILDLTDAVGSTIRGIGLRGRHMGKNMHGVSMSRDRREVLEHSIRIEDCQFAEFSGNGANMVGVWAFSMRGSQCFRNDGYGLYLDGCDGFIVDNWFGMNRGPGFGGDTWNSAVTFTSHRVEWNGGCGLSLRGGMRYNLPGNFFDRNHGPAIIIREAENYHKRLHKTHTVMPYAIAVTGNTFVRSGKSAEPGSDDDCHIFMHRAAGVTVTGNTFNVWKDDGRDGRVSPWYGVILEQCAHCVISSNAMLPGAMKELILDRGGHGPGVVISDNVGETVPAAAWGCQDPFTPVHLMSEGGAPWYADQLKGESNN
jgi:hypothetical protein